MTPNQLKTWLIRHEVPFMPEAGQIVYAITEDQLLELVEQLKTITTIQIHGWRCPVCGKGLSPYITKCDCAPLDMYRSASAGK